MTLGIIVFSIYFISVMQMHYRGSVKFSFYRQLFTHTNYLAPFNVLMNLSSRLPTTPYVDVDQLPELSPLVDNWQVIKEEALALSRKGGIKMSSEKDDVGFDSFFKTGWSRFYLKWYEGPLPSALRDCPKTVELLEQVPSIKGAMFARLPVGGELRPHRDPFAGCLRFHLGLVTPNAESCYIKVDGLPYSWKDGEAILFDETYIHEAHNKSDVDRIILFCDVIRPTKFAWLDRVNEWICRSMMAATATKNEDGEKVGAVNKLFGKVHGVREFGKRFKEWNKPLYKTTKYALYLLILYLIFFS